MSDLTDAQLVILSAAAQHDDGAVLPLPSSLKFNTATIARVVNSLLKRGLVAEHRAKADEPAWREGKDGRRFALTLTAAGRKAIGADDVNRTKDKAAMSKKPGNRVGSTTKSPPGRPAAKAAAEPKSIGARKGTKLALLTELLSRKCGGTISEAMKATGWQAHSVRGAISGGLKKKLGFAVASEAIEGRGRVYRIASRA